MTIRAKLYVAIVLTRHRAPGRDRGRLTRWTGSGDRFDEVGALGPRRRIALS